MRFSSVMEFKKPVKFFRDYVSKPSVIYIWFSPSWLVLFEKVNGDGKILGQFNWSSMPEAQLSQELAEITNERSPFEVIVICSRVNVLQKQIPKNEKEINLKSLESLFPFPLSQLSWGLRQTSDGYRMIAIAENDSQAICHLFTRLGFEVLDIVSEDQIFEMAHRISSFKKCFWLDYGKDRVVAMILEGPFIKQMVCSEINSGFDSLSYLQEIQKMLSLEDSNSIPKFCTCWEENIPPEFIVSLTNVTEGNLWPHFMKGAFEIEFHPHTSLLPKAEKKQSLIKQEARFVNRLGVTLGLFFLFSILIASLPVFAVSEELSRLKRELIDLTQKSKYIQSSRLDAVEKAKRERENLLSLMGRLSQEKFKGMQLQQLQTNEKKFNLQAESPTHAMVYGLLNDLEVSRIGISLSVKSLQLRQKAGREFYLFEMEGLWRS